MWRGGRAVEGACLESKCTVTPYRGFESRPLRQSFLLTALLLTACGESTNDPPAPSPPPALAGVYSGTFPCHDCPGIETTLWLRPDGRFFIRHAYLPGEGGDPIDAYGLGRWRMAGDESLRLDGEGPIRIFRRQGADVLLLQTDSDLEHRLLRDTSETDFTSTLRLTGTIGIQADGAAFTECLTGYAVPVLNVGDFGRFRHQYRSVRAGGRPVFVEFEGHFDWSGEGTPQSVTIERFVTIRENGACR